MGNAIIWGAKKIKWPIYVCFFNWLPKGSRQCSAVWPTRHNRCSLRWEFTNVCEHSFCLMKGKNSEIGVWMIGTLLSEVLPIPASILTYSLEHSPSWEANWFSASQEIPLILWNPKVHYRIRKCPPPVPILSQIDPVHTPTSHCLKIHLNIILHLRQGLPSDLFPSGFPHQNPVYTSPLPHTCYMPCPTHTSRFDNPNNIGWGVQIIKLLIM